MTSSVQIARMCAVAEWLFDAKAGRAGAAQERLANNRYMGGERFPSVRAYFELTGTFRGNLTDNRFILSEAVAYDRIVERLGDKWGLALAHEFSTYHPSHNAPRLANAVIELAPAVLAELERSPATFLSPETMQAMQEAQETPAPVPAAAGTTPPAAVASARASVPRPAAPSWQPPAAKAPGVPSSPMPAPAQPTGLARVIAALKKST